MHSTTYARACPTEISLMILSCCKPAPLSLLLSCGILCVSGVQTTLVGWACNPAWGSPVADPRASTSATFGGTWG